MKKTILFLALLLITSPVLAQDKGPVNVTGVKLNAPDLVKISDNVSVGLEVSKELYQHLGNDDWVAEDGDHGWSGFAKVTVKWTLFDFSRR